MDDDKAREPEIVTGSPHHQQEARETIQEPAKLMRIAAMIRELLTEVRQSSLDEAGVRRLRQIHERALAALRESLSDDLQQELDTLGISLGTSTSQSEVRIAQAQLVGWLEGLFHGIQAALYAQQLQARAQLDEIRRRGLPPGPPGAEDGRRPPGQYL